MDPLLAQLQSLLISVQALSGQPEQQARALQLKCFLAAEGLSDCDRLSEGASSVLAAGAQARRDRLWATVSRSASLNHDFYITDASLSDLDLPLALLRGTVLANTVGAVAAAQEASSKAHATMLDHHRRATQPPAPAAGPGGQAPPGTVADELGHTNSNAARGPAGPGRPGFRLPQSQQPGAAGAGPGPSGATQDQNSRPQGASGPSRWHSAAAAPGPSSASGYKRVAEAPGPAGSRDEDDEVEEVEPGGRGGGQGGGGGGAAPLLGFKTAKAQLFQDAARKGQPPPMLNQAPRAPGLMRPQKKQQTAAGDKAGCHASFKPPFAVKAAMNAVNNGGSGGGGGKAAAGAGGDGHDADSPYPPKLLEMLSARNMLEYGEDGSPILPESLAKLDPKIVSNIFSEVLDQGAPITWEDIAGQDVAKKLMQEVVVWPMLNPHLFTGPRAPPRGVLLFGPPGTGKTLLGKAVAANISATFFSISASSLTSKWIGEGEKMVRALFALSGCLAPSVIFIDEIDSILSMRKAEGEHEASRRMKTEILVQMDGCGDAAAANKQLLVIGATNRPEELDEAARRRMPKQLYIPLPCAAARLKMLQNAFRPDSGISWALSPDDMGKIVERTLGYSGSDMKNLIQEACAGPIRDYFKTHGPVEHVQSSDLRPVNLTDFRAAVRAQKRTVSDKEVERYVVYDSQFGARYSDGPVAEVEQDEDEW